MNYKKVFIYNALCNGLSIIQYLLLGAWTGVICCIIAVLRNIVFALFKKDVPFVVLAIYIIIVLLINYKLVNNVIDIIPIINIIIYAIALWTKKIRNIKVVGIITCITGVVYDLTNKAYITVLNEIIDGIVGIISLGVLLKKKESGTN